jgi:hypothetical protein
LRSISAVDLAEPEVDRANESDHDLVVVDRIRAWRRGGAFIAGNAVLRQAGPRRNIGSLLSGRTDGLLLHRAAPGLLDGIGIWFTLRQGVGDDTKKGKLSASRRFFRTSS